MTTPPANTRSMLIPCMHYDNAPAAIDWLCRAFGFEKRTVVPGDDGLIVHAELAIGDGMIMMSSTGQGSPLDRLMTHPSATSGKETQCPYVIVPDADAVYESAKAAGAEIVIDIQDEDYGGRGFTCRDPEGHLWNFGSYNPWSIDERAS